MTTIYFPSGTRDTIDAIRQAIGRSVTFYTKERTPCSGCTIDPVTGNSTNPFHEVCSGTGYVTTYSGYSCIAHITQKPLDTLDWVRGGQLFLGDMRIQVAYTAENVFAIDGCDYVIVDGKKFDVKEKEFRGVPELNRVIVFLTELTD